MRDLIGELLGDEELAEFVRSRTLELKNYRNVSDPMMRPGRRAGWYALVRALRPKVVVEAGIDKGLGSLLLCAALRRNRSEGSEGNYYGLDLDPEAGKLLGGAYKDFGELRFGSSIETLGRGFGRPIDLFIQDSNHSSDYEQRELSVVAPLMAPNGVIVSDNAIHTDALVEFAERSKKRFLVFQERPLKCWPDGESLGVLF